MEGLGLNWKVLIGQIINFAILFFLLKKFVFGRFSSILEKRKKKIEDGLKKSEEAGENLLKIRSLENEIRAAGEKNAREIVKTAEKNAEIKKQEVVMAAELERENIIKGAKERVERELREEKEKHKKEALEMSFLVAERFLKEKFDKESDKKLLEELVSKSQ